MKRFAYIEIFWGLGIILVVFGHIYLKDIAHNWIYSFHMPLFFFASGWLYKEKPIVLDIKRRIQTIVIPYFSIGLLILLYWQFFERRFRNSDLSFLQSVLGLISGQYDYLDFNVHLWFLPCFFVTVLFYNALVRIGNKWQKGRVVALLIAFIMSIIYVLIPLPSLPWGIDRVFCYIGFYAMGTVLSHLQIDEIIDRLPRLINYILVVLLILITFILSYFKLYTGIMWFVTALIGTVAVLIISMMINHNRILEYLGMISLTVLCIHGPIYRILIKLISMLLNMNTDAVRESLILAFVVTGLTLCLCAIAHQIINRFVPWMIGKNRTDKI